MGGIAGGSSQPLKKEGQDVGPFPSEALPVGGAVDEKAVEDSRRRGEINCLPSGQLPGSHLCGAQLCGLEPPRGRPLLAALQLAPQPQGSLQSPPPGNPVMTWGKLDKA